LPSSLWSKGNSTNCSSRMALQGGLQVCQQQLLQALRLPQGLGTSGSGCQLQQPRVSSIWVAASTVLLGPTSTLLSHMAATHLHLQQEQGQVPQHQQGWLRAQQSGDRGSSSNHGGSRSNSSSRRQAGMPLQVQQLPPVSRGQAITPSSRRGCLRKAHTACCTNRRLSSRMRSLPNTFLSMQLPTMVLQQQRQGQEQALQWGMGQQQCRQGRLPVLHPLHVRLSCTQTQQQDAPWAPGV
jgi:hypothetical protein